MPSSAAISIRFALRYALCAALALALGLTCAVLAAAVSTGMSSMSGGMSGTGAVLTEGAPSAAATAGTAMAVPPVATMSSQESSACKDGCAGSTAGLLCMVAAGFVLISALILLLPSPRNILMGVLARVRGSGSLRRRLRERTPWIFLSPVALCVLRV